MAAIDVYKRHTPHLALVALLDEVVDQFARGVIHFDVECFHTASEVVEGHDGGDGDEKSERRGDQGLRDTTGDCADAGGLLRGDLLEGVQDTDDGAEKADEGRRGADGGQNRKASLQRCV